MDLNVRRKTIKLLGKKVIAEKSLGGKLLGFNSKVQSIREKVDILDFVKIKNFYPI